MGNSAKTKLSWWGRERRQGLKLFCFFPGVHYMKLNNALVNKIWLKTHIEDDVEDRLEDDDVAVACSLRKLLLLLHMVFLVVDVLIVLLCHPACVCMREVKRKHTFIKKTKTYLFCTVRCVCLKLRTVWVCMDSHVHYMSRQSKDWPLPQCMSCSTATKLPWAPSTSHLDKSALLHEHSRGVIIPTVPQSSNVSYISIFYIIEVKNKTTGFGLNTQSS